MAGLVCDAKHLPDVPDDEFYCPKCESKTGDFYIEEGHHENECEKLKATDLLYCSSCAHSESAGTFVRRWMRKKSLVKCQHCNGEGMVSA